RGGRQLHLPQAGSATHVQTGQQRDRGPDQTPVRGRKSGGGQGRRRPRRARKATRHRGPEKLVGESAVALAGERGVTHHWARGECRVPQSLDADNHQGVLSQLTLRNFAIVDHLEIDWHAGLNVITGETGAGKSILIDAVGALLGDRLGPEGVRSGARRAMVAGGFTLPAEIPADLGATLRDLDLEAEDGALIVNREIAGSGGRGSARINGRGVPLSVVVSLGERLVDVHGQSEHMALLRPREQLVYLDRYASAMPERAEVGRLFRELRAIRAEHQELLASEREAARLQDMLRHEIAEIETAQLNPGEEDELALQRARLEHVERLREAAQLAVAALSGGDETDGAIDLLARAVGAS